MNKGLIDKAASDITSQAQTGYSAEGKPVANTLSPHFQRYTAERIRQLLRESFEKQLAAADLVIQNLHNQLLDEDTRITENMDVYKAHEGLVGQVEQSARIRLQHLEVLRAKIQQILRSTAI